MCTKMSLTQYVFHYFKLKFLGYDENLVKLSKQVQLAILSFVTANQTITKYQ